MINSKCQNILVKWLIIFLNFVLFWIKPIVNVYIFYYNLVTLILVFIKHRPIKWENINKNGKILTMYFKKIKIPK